MFVKAEKINKKNKYMSIIIINYQKNNKPSFIIIIVDQSDASP
jgi:hypothetical protein